MTGFDRAFSLIISVEGGESNHPRDPGGLTKWGISQKAYPSLDMSTLTLDQAKAIYRRDYWDRCRCDALPWPLSLFVFDAAVNQGVGPSSRLLQKALGVTVDGVIGPKTISAAQSANVETEALFMAERAIRYVGTANFTSFGLGWMKRLFVVALEAET